MPALIPQRHAVVSLGVPWTNCFGAARSLIALGPLLTLVFTRSADLFFSLAGDQPERGRCTGVGRVLLFCLDGGDQFLEAKRWVAVLVLATVVSGWRPRFSCLPHAYVAFSFFNDLSVPEGGDQIASILALLLVPLCLTDSRTWHWQRIHFSEKVANDASALAQQLSRCVAIVAIVVIKLQLSWLYIQAAISKLGNEAWVNGTAMYYWSRNANFGAPSWQEPFVYWLTSQPALVAAMTWIPIGIELSLGTCLLLPMRTRIPLLCAGMGLHLLIGVMIGLWSFAVIMMGCLVFLLSPTGLSLDIRRKPVTHREGLRTIAYRRETRPSNPTAPHRDRMREHNGLGEHILD